MNFIAKHGFPAAILGWPETVPTDSITVGHLVFIAQVVGFQFSEVAFLVTKEALRRIELSPDYPGMAGCFWYLGSGHLPRYDFVNHEWVERTHGTPEYEGAMCEDAFVMIKHKPETKQSLRFRRVVQIEDLEFLEQ